MPLSREVRHHLFIRHSLDNMQAQDGPCGAAWASPSLRHQKAIVCAKPFEAPRDED
jgi:hypothetical protein